MKKPKVSFNAKDIAVMGMMLALLEAGKRALDAVPNVEVITILLIIFTLYYGRKTLIVAVAFTACEIAFWGIHVWIIMYLYVWPLLILVTAKLGRGRPLLVYSLLAGFFGLCFGGLCSIPYLFIGGPLTMFSWWIAGIPLDIVHAVSNFLICLILFKPLSLAMEKVMNFLYPPQVC